VKARIFLISLDRFFHHCYSPQHALFIFPDCGLPSLVTVTGLIPPFVAISDASLAGLIDFFESSVTVACFGDSPPSFSEHFSFSELVLAYFPPPPSFSSTDTVLPFPSLYSTDTESRVLPFYSSATVSSVSFVFLNTTDTDLLTLSHVEELSSFVLPFNIDLGDHRLEERCARLILSPLNHTQHTAAGISPPAELLSTFATTQAAWRFLNNPRITPHDLMNPIHEFVQSSLKPSSSLDTGQDFVLGAIDWSKIDYSKHSSKKDVVPLTHETDIGYELTTLLLVNPRNGLPIAPVEMYLKTSEMVHTTSENPVTDKPHLEQVLDLMKAGDKLQLPCPIIYVIDREADALWYWRQWDAAGQLFIIRGDDDRLVLWHDHYVRYSLMVDELEKTQQFQQTIELEVQGKKCYQEVAETSIILDKPANHTADGQKKLCPGQAMTLRLISSRIDEQETQELVSEWFLLTNTPPSLLGAERAALCYYFRWNIETYFKQMKSAGLEMEHWQQQTGHAVMMRLLVAAMALVTVWQLQQLTTPEATEFKDWLVRLSGKTHKRKKPYTSGILLSGLFVALRIVDFLEEWDYDIEKIKNFRKILRRFIPP
jgi:hypothetical protein